MVYKQITKLRILPLVISVFDVKVSFYIVTVHWLMLIKRIGPFVWLSYSVLINSIVL